MDRPLIRALFLGLFCVASVIAVCGGIALSIVTIVDPKFWLLPHLEHAWLLALGGFFFMAFFYVAVRLADAAAPSTSSTQVPAPAEPPKVEEKQAEKAPEPKRHGAPDAPTALQQMRTYIGIEMWDLALDKANEILERFAGTPEAEIVSRNINELRWKAEPKPPPPSPAPKVEPRKGEDPRKMLQHARTYVELEMWDLARERALEVAKLDPESPEAAEAARMLVDIEKRAAVKEPRTIVEP